jgi:hypothetical protein
MAGALLGATTANADTKIDDTHVRVEAGDTVSGIANKYGTDVSTIASASNLSDANKIFVGDILVLTPEAQQPTTNNVQTPVANQAQPASQATVNTQPVQNQPVQSQAPVQQSTTPVQSQPATSAVSGSVHDQRMIAIVMPESGGNPNATNGQYSGLGQTNQSWGTGSVASQTQGMINYANSRYGSVAGAVAFRQAHGWW